jgi:cytochrome c
MKVSPVILLLIIFLWSWKTIPAKIEILKQIPPQVKISIPGGKKEYTWNEQVRYSISVSDSKDGDSKYDEIPPQECLLELAYLPVYKEEEIKKVTEKKEEKGLSLMKKSTCFGCHAHKTKLAGPSFQEIAERYETTGENIKTLGNHILNGSIGVWENQQMPAHPDFTEEQCRQIASYILEMGDHPYRWIFPGLEGTFRTMNKPEVDQGGVYVLTARYTSTSGAEGKHSLVLKIR